MTDKNKEKIFRLSWVFLVLGTVCDLGISENFDLGFFTANIQLSSVAAVVFLICFLFAFPLRKFNIILGSKYNLINLSILFVLLILAYVSSLLSVMPKYALLTTTSRYALYFLALAAALGYSMYFENAGNFILRTFIYFNFFIAISSLAEYFIQPFYQVLIKYFGVMEATNSIMRIDSVVYMRPSGFITDSNLAAFTLAFSSYLLLINRDKFNRYFEILFYILAGICSGLLASRTALLAALLLLAAAIILKQVSWKYVLICFILLVMTQAFAPQTKARFLNILDPSNRIEELEKGRPLIWQGAMLAMHVKPLTGIGSGMFFKQSDIYISRSQNEIDEQQYYSMISDPAHKNKEGINPHNIFFSGQIEHGVAATVLFVVLMIYNVYYFVKKRKFNSLAAGLSILFVSTLSNYAPYYKYYLLLLIIFYVTAAANSKLTGEISEHQ